LEELEGRLLLNSHPVGEVPHHIHPHLAIFVDGENFTIPADVGISLGVVLPNENAHTHADDGVIHYNEATPVFRNLDEFFDTWGGTFNQTQLRLPTAYHANGQPSAFIDRVVDATHTIKFFVNGAASSDFEQYEPEDGDQIVISYETIAAANAPTLNPINNVTMSSNPGASAPDRDFYVPLDGSDPNNDAITYTATVSPSGSAIAVEVVPPTNAAGDNPVLQLSVSGFDIDGQAFTGNLVFELFRDDAPDTVDRIMQLVNQGFYTGLSFHRVVNDFVAQGGDPSGNGSGGSGVDFDDEYDAQITFNGFGQLAMANSGDDTNDSQFFITDSNLSLLNVAPDSGQTSQPPSHLNFNHTIFGQLISGFDTFNKIMLTPVSGTTPISRVTINSASIVTDNQHAMLKVTAPHDFAGTATVTVTGTDTTSLTVQRSFEVNVVSDTTNDRAFLGTLNDVTTVVNTPVNVPLPATDLEGDTLTFVVRDPNNFFSVPANVSVSIDQNSRIATITPATNFTGTVELLVGVRDQTDRDGDFVLDEQTEFDTQRITLTVSPNSSAITGRKFHDLDADAVQDVGESGLQGWVIQLDSGADGTIDFVTTTAADGTYSFTALPPGTYRVREQLQTGWTQTTANPVDIVLDGLNSTTGVDFGNFQQLTIAGRKFHDLDGDGTDDGGADPGLAGWTIQLDTGADGTVDVTAITAADGTYQFPDLGPGVYRVGEVLQSGFVQTTANPADITGTSGTNVGGADFGNFELITINGRKFEDSDGDGTDDTGSDSGLPGWTIELDIGADGTVDATTTTAADGSFSFTDLGPGTYRVREVLQTGWMQTTSNPTDTTATSGVNRIAADFGNFQLITISGQKVNDLDGGGTRDPGEPGLEGWTIFLDSDDNGQLDDGEQSTTSDADGNFSFGDLGPGVFRVREVLQAGWINTFSIAGIVALSGDDVADVDVGNFQLITISGRKFHDRDNDGTDNGGSDAGLAGWVIELDVGANGTVDATVTTAFDGAYSFTDLGPGTYRVREQIQPGWIQSTPAPADIVATTARTRPAWISATSCRPPQLPARSSTTATATDSRTPMSRAWPDGRSNWTPVPTARSISPRPRTIAACTPSRA
jgi:cyclophilin family peptidyl-prolyl cis-trans isomerase